MSTFMSSFLNRRVISRNNGALGRVTCVGHGTITVTMDGMPFGVASDMQTFWANFSWYDLKAEVVSLSEFAKRKREQRLGPMGPDGGRAA